MRGPSAFITISIAVSPLSLPISSDPPRTSVSPAIIAMFSSTLIAALGSIGSSTSQLTFSRLVSPNSPSIACRSL